MGTLDTCQSRAGRKKRSIVLVGINQSLYSIITIMKIIRDGDRTHTGEGGVGACCCKDTRMLSNPD